LTSGYLTAFFLLEKMALSLFFFCFF